MKSERAQIPGPSWSASGLSEVRRVHRLNLFALLAAFIILAGLVMMGFYTEVDVSVPARGEVAPATLVELVAEVEGQVKSVRVRHGDTVEPGDLILELLNDDLQAQYEEARATVQTALSRKDEVSARLAGEEQAIREEIAQKEAAMAGSEARVREIQAGGDPRTIAVARARLHMASIELEYAALELEKAESLLQKGVLQSKKRDEAETRYRLAQASHRIALEQLAQAESPYSSHDLESAQAGLQEASHAVAQARARLSEIDVYRAEIRTLGRVIEETNIRIGHLERQQAKLRVVAGVRGKILTDDVERQVGRWVRVGEPLVEIGEEGRFVVDGYLREEYLPRVKVGLPAKVYLRAFPFREYQVLQGELAELSEKFTRRDEQGAGKDEGKPAAPIRVTLSQAGIEHDGEEVPLRAGLSAEVEIVIRRAGLWDLLKENVQRWRSEPMGR
jgi:multidrug resistance efflux pump